MQPATYAAAQLMSRGAAVLSAASTAGIRIDVPYMKQAITDVGNRIRAMEMELREFDEFKLQRKIFGEKINIDSDDQLRRVFYDEMKHEPKAWTRDDEEDEEDRGKPKMDEAALLDIGTAYTTKLIERKKLSKLKGTYLEGILSETVDGYIHPNQTLHKVVTYRGACEDPNFTNIPIRNPEQAKIIRPAFIPRDGHVLLEMDLKANEVRVGCSYHHDKTMIQYILDDYDMHSDMARECYFIGGTGKAPKGPRDIAKSFFVFAEFYGSYYVDVARHMWEEAADVSLPDGTLLHDHLRANGIKEMGDCLKGKRQDPRPGTFEAHIQKVEKAFWGERFPVYNEWRHQWWKDYLAKGYFHTLTGFTVTYGTKGLLKRNECINSPVQGSAFHCLLWGIIQLDVWLRKNKMRSVIVGQIHDSVIIDAHANEWQEVAAKFKEIMVVSIRNYYRWLIVPLGLEASMSANNWYEKEEVHI